jgi:arylsulfatase A-like enzyme
MKRSGRLVLASLSVLLVAGLLVISCSHPKPHARPNVVLIVGDAMRPDFLGCYGYERPTSPNVDELARSGIVFENAISHAPWTKTSFSTFLSSLYPFEHGVLGWESVMPDSVSTLPEVLAGAGYSTMAVINMLGITGQYKVTKGFEKISEADKGARDALATSDDAIALIKGARKPFFIMIHYFDTHRPYRPPPEDVDLILKPGDPNPFAARVPISGEGDNEKQPEDAINRDRLLYAGCVKHIDSGIGRLIKYLDEAGLRRNTLVIVTADHGEAFWEHGVMAHGSNLYDEAIKVPLIIDYPARYARSQRIGAQARQIDLLPTILDLAGIPDERHREGTSLRPLIETGKRGTGPARWVPADVALCECSLKKTPDSRCLRTNDLKLIVEPSTALCELYDLQADPRETINTWGRGGAAADSIFRMMGRIPGTDVNGWRVAFTGEGSSVADAEVALPGGSRLIGIQKVTTPGGLELTVAADSASFKIRAHPAGLQIVMFDVEPKDARVAFRVNSEASGPGMISVGKAGTRRSGEHFTVGPEDATGLPDGFEQGRAASAPGVYIWWLPGGSMRAAGEGAVLSQDAKKRLRSLGYVQ